MFKTPTLVFIELFMDSSVHVFLKCSLVFSIVGLCFVGRYTFYHDILRETVCSEFYVFTLAILN